MNFALESLIKPKKYAHKGNHSPHTPLRQPKIRRKVLAVMGRSIDTAMSAAEIADKIGIEITPRQVTTSFYYMPREGYKVNKRHIGKHKFTYWLEKLCS